MDERVKELLEKIRGTASLAADVASDTARFAGQRAGQMLDGAKLNVQMFDLNTELDNVLKQLGQVMYDTHRGETPTQDVAKLLQQADQTAEKIADLRRRMTALRDSTTCPACGAACAQEDQFCRSCGKTLK